MAKRIFPLNKLRQEHSVHVDDTSSGGLKVLHVSHPHSLIQAAGYLKHTLAAQNGSAVYFRGQTKLYPSLGPNLFRGVAADTRLKRMKALNGLLERILSRRDILRAVPAYSHEALLQHYGIRTTWLDVVDNIWVALWFACHDAKDLLRGTDAYLHFEKRVPRRTAGRSAARFAYVLLIESAHAAQVDGEPGHYREERSETIDLRVAAPSQFVRPHAQPLLSQRLSVQVA